MSESEEEDFVMYGTPLDPIEEDDLKRKKPTSVEDQIVTDEQGRRRFHGAFTGGFSAGFYNSVGTRDGWSPATFTSSRQKRNATMPRGAEHYMDDEDVGEFGFAPKGIIATDTFISRLDSAKLLAAKRRKMEAGTEVIPGASFLEDMITPVKDSKGVVLLRQMGWKPGQGVGPRVSKDTPEEGEEEERKVYGCHIPEEFRKTMEKSEITFAPDDAPAWILVPKKDLFGLGYSGLQRGNVLGLEASVSGPKLVMAEKGNRRVKITGQAFGVGAFEEEDEDIYGTEDLTKYDFELKSNVEKQKSRDPKDREINPYKKYEGDDVPGFVLSRVVITPKIYKPPPIPDSYRPKYRLYPSCKGIREPNSSRWDIKPVERAKEETQNVKVGLNRHSLSSRERGALLGEEAAPRKELNEQILSLGQEPVEDVTPASTALALLPTKAESKFSGSTFRPKIRPFSRDLEKQKRYEQYLVLRQNNQADQLKSLQPSNMLDADRAQEQAMFERAATVYEPLNSGIMSRFVSSGTTDATKPLPEIEIQPDVKAANMKMYGKLTRIVAEWFPGDLLCKRFNVKNPHPDSKEAQSLQETKPKTRLNLADILGEISVPSSSQVEVSQDSLKSSDKTRTSPPRLVSPVEKKVDVAKITVEDHSLIPEACEEPEMIAEEDIQRPSIDLFRAIFDEDSEDESEKVTVASQEPDEMKSRTTPPKNHDDRNSGVKSAMFSSRNISKTNEDSRNSRDDASRSSTGNAGILANLDLKSLEEKWKTNTEALFKKFSLEKKSQKEVKISAPVDTYGPSLPPLASAQVDDELTRESSKKSSDSEDSRVSELRSGRKKMKKHKHHKKHSHKKDKKKERKKSKRRSSDT
ncbi:unnamed protein product [Notodromas monacha]|uniref:G-patch domain-containing protein n=1 Tax=Notodromas monacha TaxID=399045 RepID=A0A7R9BE37_9CRUS|nr:unnamed protein product [Notodromas monacha]CAG0913112.1 unnamed protein product [Notodromas monacha]